MALQMDVLDRTGCRSGDTLIRKRGRGFGTTAVCAALLTMAVAVASPNAAFACFAPPGAKPHSTFELIALTARPAPAIVYRAAPFTVYLAPDDLLTVLLEPEYDVRRVRDLANALQMRLPLARDLDVEEIKDAVIPDAIRSSGDDHEMENVRAGADERVRFAVAALLEREKAAVERDGRALEQLTFERWTEPCRGGRRFRGDDGAIVLHTGDWIS